MLHALGRTSAARGPPGWRSVIGGRRWRSRRRRRRTAARPTARPSSSTCPRAAALTSARMSGPWAACCTSSCTGARPLRRWGSLLPTFRTATHAGADAGLVRMACRRHRRWVGLRFWRRCEDTVMRGSSIDDCTGVGGLYGNIQRMVSTPEQICPPLKPIPVYQVICRYSHRKACCAGHQ